MEKFEGNGAECMVRFINGGFNGTIFRAGLQSAFLNKRIWEEERDTYSLSWLSEPATYYPPEPKYKDATPGEALDAWLAQREVHERYRDGTPFVLTYGWRPVCVGYEEWGETDRQYRIRID